ncbi:MBL fold metallo-hydrolase [Streptomyces sp. NPDC003233]
MTAKLTVVRSGALTTVQDGGRRGHAHLGVPRSGALDAAALRLANLLLGNAPGAAVLETTLTGCALRPDRGVTVVVGGAPCPVTVDGRPAPWGAIARALGGRTLRAIVCTHAHNDHIDAAPDLAARTGAPVLLHADDLPLWKQTHPDRAPDGELTDGQRLAVAGVELTVLHTPGHAPGAVCLYAPHLSALFSGDTLFAGGPGATGRSYSDFPTIIRSLRERLLALPDDTVVHTGHGDTTTIGAEAPHLQEWIERGF